MKTVLRKKIPSMLLCTGLLIGQLWAHATISYADLMARDENGELTQFAQSFSELDLNDRIALLTHKEVDEDTLKLRVTGLPTRRVNDDTELTVEFEQAFQGWDVHIIDSAQHACLCATYDEAEVESTLHRLGKGACDGCTHPLCQDSSVSRKLSGTVLMNVWDSLCTILNVGVVELADQATIGILDLASLYPFIGPGDTPTTWYGKWGYRPQEDQAEFDHALKFLTSRTVAQVYKDFRNDCEVRAILRAHHPLMHPANDAECRPSACQHTFRAFMQALYQSYRLHPSMYELAFKTLYEKCIADYYSPNAEVLWFVRHYQNTIFKQTDFEKDYCGNASSEE